MRVSVRCYKVFKIKESVFLHPFLSYSQSEKAYWADASSEH